MDILFLVIGLGAGIAIGWLVGKRNSRTGGEEDQTAELHSLKGALDESNAENIRLGERTENQKGELSRQQEELEQLRKTNTELTGKLESSRTHFLDQQRRIDEQKQEIEQLNEKFTKEFENVANRILRQNSDQISKMHQEKLFDTLKPLGERIKSFEEKISESSKERNTLRGEIKALVDLNQRMGEEARNLSRALKGDTKQQGNWGEIILERILEQSGLIKDREYKLEFSTQNVEGRSVRPDAVVFLPDNKHIIVDSKVSLVDFERLVNAEDKESQAIHAKAHVQSILNHVKGLSEKAYQTSVDLNTPDFVLLFMPMEAAFSTAVQENPDLFTHAWDKRIVIVSPTTLLATLRTIASIWKQEHQTKNALEIAEKSGRLYDKFVGFVEDLKDIDKNITRTREAYNKAWNKLVDGRGNLVTSVETIKKLGAKASKAIDQNLLEQDHGDETN